jgi:hypothetical protein
MNVICFHCKAQMGMRLLCYAENGHTIVFPKAYLLTRSTVHSELLPA